MKKTFHLPADKTYSRTASFVIAAAVYVIALALGVLSYLWLAPMLRTSPLASVAGVPALGLRPSLAQCLGLRPILERGSSADDDTLGNLAWQLECPDRPPSHRGLDVGLWKHGRHPNYFGEVLMWWAVWLIYVSVAGLRENWWLVSGAVANTLLFLGISIPLMEARQLRNKPGYAEYRRHTRLFI